VGAAERWPTFEIAMFVGPSMLFWCGLIYW